MYTKTKGKAEINTAIFKDSKPPTYINAMGNIMSVKAQNKRCHLLGSCFAGSSSVAQDAKVYDVESKLVAINTALIKQKSIKRMLFSGIIEEIIITIASAGFPLLTISTIGN